MDNLRTLLQSQERSETQEQLTKMRVSFEDFLHRLKSTTAIDPEKVDWKMLDSLGLSRERLEQSEKLKKLFNWQKSNFVTIAVPVGDTSLYTKARSVFRTDENGNIGLAVHSMRKEPQLDYPYMGYIAVQEKFRVSGKMQKRKGRSPYLGDQP